VKNNIQPEENPQVLLLFTTSLCYHLQLEKKFCFRAFVANSYTLIAILKLLLPLNNNMPTEKDLIHISKFLSLVLRHKPETISIQLDVNGWADIDELIEKSSDHGIHFDRELLSHIVATNSKKRFAFNETGNKIRASQGHSIEIDLAYTPQKPPEFLYHGTGENSVQSILKAGLERRGRQHVHLSGDIDTAINVGQRHGKPFVFKVLAGKMYDDKFEFFRSENNVWLTDKVPVEYLARNE